MKSIITFAACMTFAILINAQVQDSVINVDLDNMEEVPIPRPENYIDVENIVEEKEEVFFVVEVAPEFPGGLDSLMKYLQENITYPKEARDANIQGIVYVTFIVEANGSVSSVKVLRGIGGGCDEEAARVVKEMPAWKPGTQRGKQVRVQFNLPVRFILHDPEPDKKTE